MAEKLTHDEHTARALLLGRWYDWRDGTYNLHINFGPDRFMNAMTLEIETSEVVTTRVKKWGNDYAINLMHPKPTPYARM